MITLHARHPVGGMAQWMQLDCQSSAPSTLRGSTPRYSSLLRVHVGAEARLQRSRRRLPPPVAALPALATGQWLVRSTWHTQNMSPRSNYYSPCWPMQQQAWSSYTPPATLPICSQQVSGFRCALLLPLNNLHKSIIESMQLSEDALVMWVGSNVFRGVYGSVLPSIAMMAYMFSLVVLSDMVTFWLGRALRHGMFAPLQQRLVRDHSQVCTCTL